MNLIYIWLSLYHSTYLLVSIYPSPLIFILLATSAKLGHLGISGGKGMQIGAVPCKTGHMGPLTKLYTRQWASSRTWAEWVCPMSARVELNVHRFPIPQVAQEGTGRIDGTQQPVISVSPTHVSSCPRLNIANWTRRLTCDVTFSEFSCKFMIASEIFTSIGSTTDSMLKGPSRRPASRFRASVEDKNVRYSVSGCLKGRYWAYATAIWLSIFPQVSSEKQTFR